MSYILLILAVILGVTLVFILKPSKKFVQLLLAFSGAYLLSVTILHLLPDVYIEGNDYKSIGIYILIGIILQSVLESFSKGAEHGHVHIHGKISSKELFVIFIGLSIHSFIEGIPVNTLQDLNHSHVTSFDSFSWVYLTAILIHKLPIAAVLIIFLNSINSSFKRKIIFLLLFAISSPSGAFFGEYLVESSFFSEWSNNFLAI